MAADCAIKKCLFLRQTRPPFREFADKILLFVDAYLSGVSPVFLALK